MFYPDIKKHISPSAFSAFHASHSLFVRSYFKNERSPETAAMKAGKKIHALVEAGLLTPKHKFVKSEETLVVSMQCVDKGTDEAAEMGAKFDVLGIPDSHETEPRFNTTWEGGLVSFVDYKSGKENTWSPEKIGADLKMLLTAWLVLQANPHAKNVEAIIEYIPTQWNDETKEIEPTGGEHVTCSFVFTNDILSKVPELLKSTVEKVNEEYEQFCEASDALINEDDVSAFVELNDKIDALKTEQDVIKGRIKDQLDMGGSRTYESEFGTFYFTERKTYDYPDDLEFQTEDGTIRTFALGKEIVVGMSAVKKQYELMNEPASVTRSMGFRAKKAKKK